ADARGGRERRRGAGRPPLRGARRPRPEPRGHVPRGAAGRERRRARGRDHADEPGVVSTTPAAASSPRSAPPLPRPRRMRIGRALGRAWDIGFVAFVGAVLYGPVILLAIFSFNDSISVSLPLRGFTTRWYSQILDDDVMRTSIQNSLVVALIVTPVCLVLG